MTEVNMPEPEYMGCDSVGDIFAYTEARLKQYGNDRARHALEMAAKTITATYGGITAVICANLVLKLKEKE